MENKKLGGCLESVIKTIKALKTAKYYDQTDLDEAIRSERAVSDELRKENERLKLITTTESQRQEAFDRWHDVVEEKQKKLDTLRTFAKKAVEAVAILSIDLSACIDRLSHFDRYDADMWRRYKTASAILTDPMAKE